MNDDLREEDLREARRRIMDHICANKVEIAELERLAAMLNAVKGAMLLAFGGLHLAIAAGSTMPPVNLVIGAIGTGYGLLVLRDAARAYRAAAGNVRTWTCWRMVLGTGSARP